MVKYYNPERVRQQRIDRISAGICPICGVRPIEPGYKRCRECALHESEYMAARRERRREAGLCPRCGKPVTSWKQCDRCRAYNSDFKRRKRNGENYNLA